MRRLVNSAMYNLVLQQYFFACVLYLIFVSLGTGVSGFALCVFLVFCSVFVENVAVMHQPRVRDGEPETFFVSFCVFLFFSLVCFFCLFVSGPWFSVVLFCFPPAMIFCGLVFTYLWDLIDLIDLIVQK